MSTPLRRYPFPSVDPAFDFCVLLELSFARVLPAFDNCAFDGLLDFPDDLPTALTSSIPVEQKALTSLG